ncbi:MAG TPA: helix-turn-helix domain-containing protein [Solirubrobacteraceae bacterium]
MAAHESEESYLTVAEVAATLKLNQQTVRNWIDAGTLPALRVGRRVRIKRSDFDRIIEESYSGAAAPPAGARPDPTPDDFWGGGSVGVADAGRQIDDDAGDDRAG